MNEVNPKDWHNTRYINCIPKHFVRVSINSIESIPDILKWITANGSGRYGILTTNIDQNDNGLFHDKGAIIGFEDPGDATMFTLFYK